MKRVSMKTWTVMGMVCLSVFSVAKGAPKAKGHRSVTWEKFKVSGPALKQIGWLDSRHSKEIASSPW